MDLGERKKNTVVKESHRHGLSYCGKNIQQVSEIDTEVGSDISYKTFHYDKDGVYLNIEPQIIENSGRTDILYKVCVKTFGPYEVGEWIDNSSFKKYAGAVEYALEQIQIRLDTHVKIVDSLKALSNRVPELMIDDGHGNETLYKKEQDKMENTQKLESILFDGNEKIFQEENPNIDAKVLKKI